MRSALQRLTGLTLVVGALPLVTACAPQDKYDSLMTANRSLKEQVAAAEQERDQARSNLAAAQDQLTRTSDEYRDLEQRYENLNESVKGLDEANEDSIRRIAQLEIGPLPQEVETAIQNLTARYPDVMTFDSEAGMLRFSSDFTFDLGSTEIKDPAARSLRTLAGILNEDVAKNLEARIIGHTDNVPIRKPSTLAKHPTNMHLSVHRAIAVGEALETAGINANRIQVAGFGEFRPIVPNGPRGAAQNRRVEIFVTTKGAVIEGATTFAPLRAAGDTAASAEPTQETPMK
ncbi:MAG: OmpA family protein [Planctomycetota bacterium]|jgi:flagellar motor protein MotB